MENLSGRRLGKYEIQSEIGRGGMAVVYRGFDTMLQRAVAIKVLPPRLAFDQQFVQRFHREAVMAANLRHPNIVTIHDVGEQDGVHFIVMEFLEGITLDQWLVEQGAMSLRQAGRVIREVADALDYAHGRGIVHRDIKPSNIMLNSLGHATLMDFGLVRAGEGSALTRTGMVIGTPEYMAPEQALGEPVDGRTDIYALGVVVYRMLTGKVPFSHSTPYAVTYAHVHEPPPPLRQVRPELSPAVEAVVLKALAKKPEDRYRLAGDLAAAYQQALSEAPVPAAASTVAAQAGQPPIQGSASVTRQPGKGKAPAQRQPQGKPRGRSSLPLFIGLTALLLVIAISAFWALNNGVLGGRPPATATQAAAPATAAPAIVLATPTPSATITSLPTHTWTPVPPVAKPSSTPTAPAEQPTSTPTTEPEATSTPTPRPPTPTPEPPTPTQEPPTPTREPPAPTDTPLPVVPAPTARPGLVLDFERFGTWERGDEPYGSLSQTQERRHEGSYAARLAYDIPAADPNRSYVVFLPRPPVAIPGQPTALTLWVYGDGSNHFLNGWIGDGQGEVRQFTFGRVSHAGSWQPMTMLLDTGADWPQGHISGPDNSRLDYPIRLEALVLDAVSAEDVSGTLYLDELTTGTGGTTPPVASQPTSPPANQPASQPANQPTNLTGRIAYAEGNGSTTDIKVLDVATGNTWFLFANARQPDVNGGGRVVVNGAGGGRLNLFTLPVAGGGDLMTGLHPEDSYPHWAPWGTSAVFYSTLQGDGRERVYVQRDMGQAVEPEGLKVAGVDAFGRYPTWQANGRIAYTGCNWWGSGSDCGIWSVDNDGAGNPVRLSNRPDDISSDSSDNRLLYSSQGSGNWEIYRVLDNGSSAINLTNHPGQDVGATFSPDGSAIAFISNRDGSWGIWAMGANGSSPRKLLTVAAGFGPDWVGERLAWGR